VLFMLSFILLFKLFYSLFFHLFELVTPTVTHSSCISPVLPILPIPPSSPSSYPIHSTINSIPKIQECFIHFKHAHYVLVEKLGLGQNKDHNWALQDLYADATNDEAEIKKLFKIPSWPQFVSKHRNFLFWKIYLFFRILSFLIIFFR
jgi:hypothetical protein